MKKTLIVDKNSIRNVCLEAGNLFSKWNILPTDSDDLVLALEESLTNIYEHGYCGENHNHCTVVVEIFKAHLKVFLIITDCGKIFNFDGYKSPEKSTYIESHIIGGFGISIIKKIMDEVIHFRLNHENVLIMLKEVKLDRLFVSKKIQSKCFTLEE